MLNAKLLSLITKLTGAMLSAKDVGVKNNAPYDQKPAYKPVNGNNSGGFKPSFGGDFKDVGQSFVSPKQSAIDMLNRHTQMSKRIDKNNGDWANRID